MKYGLIITDLTIDQAQSLLKDLPAAVAFTSSPAPSAPATAAPAAAPTPPARPSAPAAPVTAAPAEVDSNGMPWDTRIHSSNKTKNKDGSWKRRKGIDDATVAAVEAELKPVESVSAKLDRVETSMTAPTPPAPPSAPAAPTPPAPPAPPVAAPPPAAPAPAAPPAPPAAPAAPSRDFEGLMAQISKLFAVGAIDPAYPNTIVERINKGFNISTVTTLTDIADSPQHVDYAWQCLDVDGKAA